MGYPACKTCSYFISGFCTTTRPCYFTGTAMYPSRFQPKSQKITFFMPKIKNVIFDDPAIIVFWEDDTKTIVKAQGDDAFDPEKGLAMAIAKKALGNKGNYCEVFKQWLPEEPEFLKKDLVIPTDEIHRKMEEKHEH